MIIISRSSLAFGLRLASVALGHLSKKLAARLHFWGGENSIEQDRGHDRQVHECLNKEIVCCAKRNNQAPAPLDANVRCD